MMIFLDTMVAGSTIGEWLLAVGILVGLVVVWRVIYATFRAILGKLDHNKGGSFFTGLVKAIEKPALIAVFVAGTVYAVEHLELSEQVTSVLNHGRAFVLFLDAGFLLSQLTTLIFERILLPWAGRTESQADDHILPVVRAALKFLFWTLAVILAFDNVGMDVMSLVAGLGLGGLAFALAAQDTVANFFGGINLFLDMPFQVGDRIIVQGHDGVVVEIGLRTTKLRCWMYDRTIIIPNSIVANANIVNASAEVGRRIYTHYLLDHKTSVEDVEWALAAMWKAVDGTGITIAGESFTALQEAGTYSYNIDVGYRLLPDLDYWESVTTVNLALMRVLEERGIAYATPPPKSA